MKRVVYTCIVNGRDVPKRIAVPQTMPCVLFTDDPQVAAPDWEVRPLAWNEHVDPWRVARWHKHHPALLFPDAEESIWIDGTHAPVRDLQEIFRYLEMGNDMAMFLQPGRTTAAAEAEAVKRFRLDYADVVDRAMSRYRSEGFPDDRGFFSTAVMVRRHSFRTRRFQETWWGLIHSGSRRDQVSLPVALWKHGLHVTPLPGKARVHSTPIGVVHRPNLWFDVTIHTSGQVPKT